MPSFPGSVFSAADRSAGQVIASAHMNAVQDELNAITDGYINGTARLNSSNLSVRGNSTLASTIVFGTIPYVLPSSGGSTGQVLTCVSTSGSTMGLEWRANASAEAIRLQLDAALDIANNTTLAVPWTNQIYAINSSLHSTATNPSRITPQSTGLFRCDLTTLWRSNNASTQYNCVVEDSSGGIIASFTQKIGNSVSVTAAGTKRYDVTGGYVRVVLRAVGDTNSVTASNETYFEMVKV